MAKVSVIVPVYQVEKYLPACLDSILAQKLQDLEIILVNDGTFDRSAEIMEEYGRKDPRFVLIHKENGGLSSARNAGLEMATGEYIAFLDSDDTASSEWLSTTVREADKNHADLVLFNYRHVVNKTVGPPYLPMKDEVINLHDIGLKKYFYDYWMPYYHGQEAWARLYRRDIIETHGLRFVPNNEIFAEDTLFSAMYLLHTKTITALQEPFILYLQRGDSIMALSKPNLALRLMRLAVVLTEYVKKNGKERELADVLPVLCYDKLISKGIRYDPDINNVRLAMQEYRQNPTMVHLLKRLMGISPLISYTLYTGKGFITQIRGRLFAKRWLSEDYDGAIRLIEGRLENE